jgi:hypothetical protein
MTICVTKKELPCAALLFAEFCLSPVVVCWVCLLVVINIRQKRKKNAPSLFGHGCADELLLFKCHVGGMVANKDDL